LSWKPNETNRLDTRNFSRARVRRLEAEVTYDALAQATAAAKEIARDQATPTERAIGFASPRSAREAQYALTAFGKPERLTTCDCERTSEPSLVQSVYLRNDRDIFAFLDRPDGWLSELSGTAK